MKNKIIEAGQLLKTIKINCKEKDGSGEGYREEERYIFREKNGIDYFYGYDLVKEGIRSFLIDSINDLDITDNNYSPRNGWNFEF